MVWVPRYGCLSGMVQCLSPHLLPPLRRRDGGRIKQKITKAFSVYAALYPWENEKEIAYESAEVVEM